MNDTPRPANFGPFHIRKWFLQVDETLAGEFGRLADGAPLDDPLFPVGYP